MASTELEELIRRARLLTRDEQRYLIERLEEGVYDGTRGNASVESKKAAQPLVGEELVSLLDSIANLPYTPHPDGRTDISARHDDILYPKEGKMP